MLSLKCTRTGSTEYLKYLAAGITKTDRKGDSTLLDFTLYSLSDPAFTKLVRGDYIVVDSVKYPKWFTGVIINDPALEYLGSKAGQPVWGYKYQATSDDYILNVKPIGRSLVYLNRYAGDIIKSLVSLLNPGFFDTSGVENGPLLSQVVVDPDKKFIEIVRTLSEGTSYRFYANDKKLYFKRQDDVSSVLVLNKNDQHFTPSQLTLKPVTSGPGVINDVIVVGDVEPQNYVKEYFIGTGFDAAFNLVDSVYGADSYIYLDETFSGNTINSQWQVFDNVSTPYLISNDGYLNCLGGDGSLAVHLRSNDPLPIEGHMRLTHGEWDIISGSGVICGMWRTTPSAALTGCLFGLAVNGTTINPITNGVQDNTKSVTISNTKRYVIRTIMTCESLNRSAQIINYLNQTGNISSVSSTSDPAFVTFTTKFVELDPATGLITNTYELYSETTLNGSDAFAYYVPIASNNLSCTVTNITISIPINASISFADKPELTNSSFDEWDDVNTPTGWDGFNVEQVSSTVGFACKFNYDGGPAQASQIIADKVTAGREYTFSFRAKRNAGTAGTFGAYFTYSDGLDFISETIVSVPITSISNSDYVVLNGTLTIPDPVSFDASIFLGLSGASAGASVNVDDIIIISEYENQLIGPNEIDASDGLSPVATIIAATPTAENFNSYLGVPAFNKGQSQLVFFKDSINRTTTIPIKDQVVRLSYRGAGPAIGRAVNRNSIYAEAIKWGDTGERNMVVSDPFPRPRTSEECELYASAVVAEESFDHYEGSYKQEASYFSSHPVSGGVCKLENFPDFANRAEEIDSVTTICDHYGKEIFLHEVSFGKPEKIRSLLDKINNGPKKRNNVANIPKLNPVGFSTVNTVYASDLTKVQIIGWDSEKIYISIGESLGADDLWFEIRSADYGWGSGDSRSLITRTTSTTFAIDRYPRGRAVFIRKVKKGNYLFFSEDLTDAVYTKSGCSVTKPLSTDMNGGYGQISSVAFSGSGSSISQSQVGLGVSTATFTCDVKGTAGKTVKLAIGSSSFTEQTFTLTGNWQRLSVTGATNGVTVVAKMTATEAYTLSTTKWSVESGSTETIYTRTENSQYGPTSRFTSVVNIVFPIASSTTADVEIGQIRPAYGG
jgi:hypothetical protein